MDPQKQPPSELAWDKIRQACKLTKAQGDFVGCLLTGVLAAMPTFLAAFMDCLAGGITPGPGLYKPGGRDRC